MPASRFHKEFDADFWLLISPRTSGSVSMSGFPRGGLVQSLADSEGGRDHAGELEPDVWRTAENRAPARFWRSALSPTIRFSTRS